MKLLNGIHVHVRVVNIKLNSTINMINVRRTETINACTAVRGDNTIKPV